MIPYLDLWLVCSLVRHLHRHITHSRTMVYDYQSRLHVDVLDKGVDEFARDLLQELKRSIRIGSVLVLA